MKTITKKDNVHAYIGEWFDKVYGNTYFDLELHIGEKEFFVPYQYGYDNGFHEVERELNKLGYKIRKNQRIDKYVTIIKSDKLKRNLIK